MSAQYRRVVFFRKVATQVSAQARQFRPRPSVWLSDWLSTGWSRSPLPWPQGSLVRIQSPRPLFEFRGSTGVPVSPRAPTRRAPGAGGERAKCSAPVCGGEESASSETGFPCRRSSFSSYAVAASYTVICFACNDSQTTGVRNRMSMLKKAALDSSAGRIVGRDRWNPGSRMLRSLRMAPMLF